MMPFSRPHDHEDLIRIAITALSEQGLELEFSKPVLQQLASITDPGWVKGPDIHDLTALP